MSVVNIIIDIISVWVYSKMTKTMYERIKETIRNQNKGRNYYLIYKNRTMLRSLYYVDLAMNIFFLQTLNHFLHSDKSDEDF